MKMDTTTMLMLVGAAALVWYLSQQPAATPLSIYPSLAWMDPTSMAMTPAQKASTAKAPQSLFTSTQQAAQTALLAQCVGSYPACTYTLSDTQLAAQMRL